MRISNENFKFGYIKDLEATALEMNYKNGNLSMVIVLPKQQQGLAKMVEKVHSNYNLQSISENLYDGRVIIHIPKFEIEYEVDLNSPLQKMGIKAMFEDGADFHEMFIEGASSVKISKAIHKAVIKVDETGIEAVAATCKLNQENNV